MLKKLLYLLMLPGLVACSGNLTQIPLFEDEFEQLPEGFISTNTGSLTAYHYIPGSGQSGPWTISSFTSDSGYERAWEIKGGENGNYLRQNFHNVDTELKPLHQHTHPLIVAGDSTWHNYKLEFEFSPDKLMDKCGVVFKYKNDRSYCYYGMEGNRLVIKIVHEATAPYRPFEKVLASAKFDWQAGKIYKGDVSIRENRIYTLLNDSLSLVAEDNSYTRGKVGFLSDVPADFYGLKVTTLKSEKRKMNRYRTQLSNAAAMRIAENSNPVVWKKISTPGFGTGRHLRFGDLNSDGEIDILIGQVLQQGPGEGFSELTCLTAMTTNGELLWQKGSPDPSQYMLSNDVAFQIHDIDGDGSKEVIYTRDFKIIVVEGKTGKLIKQVATPKSKDPADKNKRILGNCIYFCDLQGKSRDSDMLMMDRSMNVWAYDEHLNLLWSQQCTTGHYPYACDIDGDGKDEIAIGYSLLDDDGRILWNRDDETGDHADAVMIASLENPNDTSLKIIYGASDWGTLILDLDGKVLVHQPVGNVQSPSIANFRNDMPGLEMVSVNFWGSQGIIHHYNSEGQIYHTFEPGPYGSKCLPVNWRGDGVEYYLLNTSPGDGGMFNGEGLLVMPFPDDGHPDLCNAVLDMTGDARDEILSWDQNEIWIYTQQDGPRQGRLYKPVRNPLYNYSNYQLSISRPGWTE